QPRHVPGRGGFEGGSHLVRDPVRGHGPDGVQVPAENAHHRLDAGAGGGPAPDGGVGRGAHHRAPYGQRGRDAGRSVRRGAAAVRHPARRPHRHHCRRPHRRARVHQLAAGVRGRRRIVRRRSFTFLANSRQPAAQGEYDMIIGVPEEIKQGENRVAMTPAGVEELTKSGHSVLVQRGAGAGSGIADEEYAAAGAALADDGRSVYERADMVVKVKEPEPHEAQWLRPGQILFTYLHLAAVPELTRTLMERRVTAIGYETVQTDDGALPLLTPMSEVAGRMAVQIGAQLLEKTRGGRGVLLGGVPGVPP